MTKEFFQVSAEFQEPCVMLGAAQLLGPACRGMRRSQVALRSFLDVWHNNERLFVYDEQQFSQSWFKKGSVAIKNCTVRKCR